MLKKTLLSLAAASTILASGLFANAAGIAGQGTFDATVAVVTPISSQTDEPMFFGIVRAGHKYHLTDANTTVESLGATATTVLFNGTNGRVSVKVNDSSDNSDNYSISATASADGAATGLIMSDIKCNNGSPSGLLQACTDVKLAADLTELSVRFGGTLEVASSASNGMQKAGVVNWTVKQITV